MSKKLAVLHTYGVLLCLDIADMKGNLLDVMSFCKPLSTRQRRIGTRGSRADKSPLLLVHGDWLELVMALDSLLSNLEASTMVP